MADDHVQSVVNALGTAQQTTDQSYTYTNNGQVASVSDGKGNTTGYVYDGFDRVLTVNWPTPRTAASSTAVLNKQFRYDNLGHLIQATSGSQSVSFGYDALGRQTSETQGLGTVTSDYDAAGTI